LRVGSARSDRKSNYGKRQTFNQSKQAHGGNSDESVDELSLEAWNLIPRQIQVYRGRANTCAQ
jgi:hypothetical protein